MWMKIIDKIKSMFFCKHSTSCTKALFHLQIIVTIRKMGVLCSFMFILNIYLILIIQIHFGTVPFDRNVCFFSDSLFITNMNFKFGFNWIGMGFVYEWGLLKDCWNISLIFDNLIYNNMPNFDFLNLKYFGFRKFQ